MLASLDMGYASAVRKIRASVVRVKDELLGNVSRCTALIQLASIESTWHFL